MLRKALSCSLAVFVLCATMAVASPAIAKTGTRLAMGSLFLSPGIWDDATALGGFLKSRSGTVLSRQVIVLERYTSAGWRQVKAVRTNSRGYASVEVLPARDTKYRFRYAGNSRYAGSVSGAVKVEGYEIPARTWSGTGATTIGPFSLQRGLVVFDIASGAGDSQFSVYLHGETGSERLVSTVGSFQGSTALGVTGAGTYTIEVTSDTTWTITSRQPRQLTAPATRSFRGNGTGVSELFQLSALTYDLAWTHAGTSSFEVLLLDNYGREAKAIASGLGQCAGTTSFTGPADQYVLVVVADGPWSIEVDP